METRKTKQQMINVGIYVRLSKADERTEESVSVENQKLILEKYAKEQGWNIRSVYVDDGFSGTNQNRPDFQRMIKDVEDKFINLILIKDLSRLGRNYLEVGMLYEVFLQQHSCELVSLGEKIDDMFVIRNWFNEQHSKTTSEKSRAGKRATAMAGYFGGPIEPYGYKVVKSNNRNKLVPDEDTAPILRRIFEMRCAGMSMTNIAQTLNDEGIPSPRETLYKKKGQESPYHTRKLWVHSTLRNMFDNRVYLGHLVAMKFGSISYKNSKMYKKNEEEHIVIENNHEALITEEQWLRVQELKLKKYTPKKTKSGFLNLFIGVLYCKDCGFKMRSHNLKYTRKDGSLTERTTYYCTTYSSAGKNYCKRNTVNEDDLLLFLNQEVAKIAKSITLDKKRIEKAIIEASSNTELNTIVSYKKELVECTNRLEKIDILVEKLYEDRLSNILPEGVFKRQIEKFDKEREKIDTTIKTLNHKIDTQKPIEENTLKFTEQIEKYIDIQKWNKEALLNLVEKIEVSEIINENKKEIEMDIYYKFIGSI